MHRTKHCSHRKQVFNNRTQRDFTVFNAVFGRDTCVCSSCSSIGRPSKSNPPLRIIPISQNDSFSICQLPVSARHHLAFKNLTPAFSTIMFYNHLNFNVILVVSLEIPWWAWAIILYPVLYKKEVTLLICYLVVISSVYTFHTFTQLLFDFRLFDSEIFHVSSAIIINKEPFLYYRPATLARKIGTVTV